MCQAEPCHDVALPRKRMRWAALEAVLPEYPRCSQGTRRAGQAKGGLAASLAARPARTCRTEAPQYVCMRARAQVCGCKRAVEGGRGRTTD